MVLNHYNKEDKVLLAVDCIIFGFDKEKLKILLVQRDFEPEKGNWSLIGGFLKKEEDLDKAATRILNHLTGLNNIYMEQVYSFSKVDRDPAERTISVAYYALIDIASHDKELLKQNPIQWFNLKDAPKLIFDHGRMVERAMARLRRRALNKPIGFELLPKKFTMRQLQKLYEAILDTKLDKRNFINKFNSLDILVKLDEKDMKSSKKGAFLFQFDEEKYNRKVEDGFNFKL
ncbi:NUDIX domain-containing protein [Arenibacter sp. M-2]|uniref:NUDIX hydrolase n=1 Tax=unclassified Arenibacter TaxID=2615047 RepID=UPI000D767E20|nr:MULTISPECIES: NUDIX domain-containing protein [unclassified Arenibacter]MDL5514317.1 NUDIX domain-containing protein [Arenibacter sp. M-2]PXX25469.1 ADP-ribose pyrophosphatase YjhB (NUDIX family) [Arenibacter sp. ARW7G5Y1]|tara:strand:+ start:58697 stop:59389 length:693 start_codon:yes stop_codon:yes gene_type:complete